MRRPGAMYRIDGRQRPPARRARRRLGDRLHLGTDCVAVSHRGEVRVSVAQERPRALATHVRLRRARAAGLAAAPHSDHAGARPRSSTMRSRAQVRPGDENAAAVLEALLARAGPAPRVRIAAALRRGVGRQRGTAGRPGILSLLAGGGASDATQTSSRSDGTRGFAALDWLGSTNAELIASRQVVWEHDPYARGGYAYFDPSFDPRCARGSRGRSGRLFFAGEHTSIRWQGYMNGAVESGRRAAAEIAAHGRCWIDNSQVEICEFAFGLEIKPTRARRRLTPRPNADPDHRHHAGEHDRRARPLQR